MKRFRLSTLMLLVVIAALVAALGVQRHRASLREVEAQARIAELQVRAASLTMESRAVQQSLARALELERAARTDAGANRPAK